MYKGGIMVDPVNIEPSELLLNSIVDELQKNGFYCLENAIDPYQLTGLKSDVLKYIEVKGKRYFSIINPNHDIASNFNNFEKSDRLKKYLCELAKVGLSKNFDSSEILSVLRVVTGKNSESQSFKFHYDATVITALIPIIIPNGDLEKSGHLLAFKNFRNIRSSPFINILEKLLYQNKLTQFILSRIVVQDLKKYACTVREGNIYFFYGYRTLHANLPVDPSYIRASLLMHFGNPHSNSSVVSLIASIRHWRERLNSNKC